MPKKPLRNSQNNPGVKITLRYIIVSTLIVFFACAIAYSMFKTTVIDADKWISKANEELQRRDTIIPTRGDILAADGSILATNMNYYTMRIDFKASRFNEKRYIESLDSLCDTLAHYFPQRTRDEWHRFMSAPLAKEKKDRSSSFTFLRDLSYTESEAVKQFPYFRRWKNPNRTGLTVDKITKRCYPYGDMARRSVGRVGQTAECDKVHGISGLEYALDSLLYGQVGYSKKVPLTSKIVKWTDIAPLNGMTLTTTIDVGIQDIVEHELGEALKEYEAEWGTLVLMEVETGDIKAISNLERDDAGNYTESMNHAIQAFEPGSVMKAISMVVALEDGFVKNPETETYHIPAGLVFGGGRAIRDTHSPPVLPVSRFLEYSSNIGMTMLVAPHFKDDPNRFRERVCSLGLLDKFNTGIAGERIPYFPHLDIKAGGLTSLGRQTYGYATQIPPLYICAFYNAIANNGRFVRPRLVSKITTERGDSLIPVSYIRKHMCSPKTAATVRDMLHKVVYGPGGTAKVLADDKIDIAGKTGTSKIANERSKKDASRGKANPADTASNRQGGYVEGAYRYSFCGFFPYSAPKYTCMVMVSRPGSKAGRNAGYISGRIMLNVAKRMYSRGMLGDNPDYRTQTASTGASRSPILYATHDKGRADDLTSILGTSKVRRMRTPAPTKGGRIPDVTGLGLREAIVEIEKAGFRLDFEGDGTVATQMPAAGTAAAKGTKVHLTLQKN